jgi:hypothetical protein
MKNAESDSSKTYLLEPVTLGEIIDRALVLLKDNLKDYFIMTTIIYSPLLVLGVLFFIVFSMTTIVKDKNVFAVVFLFITVPLALFSIFAWFLLMSGVTKLTSERYNGNTCSFKEAFIHVYHNLLKLAWTFFLIGFYILGMITLGIVIMSLFFVMSTTIMIILGVLIGIIIFALSIYLTLSFTLVPQIVMIEGKSGQKALARSRELFHSSKDSLTKTATLPFFTQMFANILSGVPYVGFLLWLVVGPIPSIALTVLYYDIRINRESYDLEHRIDLMTSE